MMNYIKNITIVTISFVAILATCYLWEMMPWYGYTDETFDFIVCIVGAAAIITIVRAIVGFVRSKIGNYKLVIKLERKELEEK